METPNSYFDMIVIPSDAKHNPERGITTGGTRRCQMDGCSGERIAVRWSNNKITYPCSRGCDINFEAQTITIL